MRVFLHRTGLAWRIVWLVRLLVQGCQTRRRLGGGVHEREEALSPGIAVTAEIKTGRRGVISYLLSPLQRYVHEGLHER